MAAAARCVPVKVMDSEALLFWNVLSAELGSETENTRLSTPPGFRLTGLLSCRLAAAGPEYMVVVVPEQVYDGADAVPPWVQATEQALSDSCRPLTESVVRAFEAPVETEVSAEDAETEAEAS